MAFYNPEELDRHVSELIIFIRRIRKLRYILPEKRVWPFPNLYKEVFFMKNSILPVDTGQSMAVVSMMKTEGTMKRSAGC